MFGNFCGTAIVFYEKIKFDGDCTVKLSTNKDLEHFQVLFVCNKKNDKNL